MKKIILIIFISFTVTSLQAQRYYGIASSNYAGINGLYLNPGNLADNRMRFDFQLGSFNGNVNQNYGYVKKFKDLNNALINGDDVDFTLSSKKTNIGFNVLGEIRGPSFMLQLDKKSAIGILTRGRIVGSGTGINTDYFTFINDGIKGVKLPNGTTFTSGNLNININAFTEVGIAYGREILNSVNRYLKGGIVLKRYNGIGYYSAIADNFSVKLIDTSISKVNFNGTIKGASSNDFNFDKLSVGSALFNGTGAGLGIDIGAVYEYRPEGEDEDGDMKKSTNRYENKYKYKIGFSIQDFGGMRYKASPNNQNFSLSANNITVSKVDTANIDFDDVNSYFKSIGAVTTKDNNATKIKAPTVVTLYGDYKFSKRVYVNALITGGLVGNNGAGTRTAFQAVITPRFEGTFLDAGMPISYNGLSKDLKIGLGLRLGFLYIGSDDILGSALGITKVRSANAYVGLHVGVPYKKLKKVKEIEEVVKVVEKPTVKTLPKEEVKKDTDADGIFDEADKCPTVAGLKEFNGCPDTDGDGIQDSEDDCPSEKGSVALKGCPDTDGDGVADKNDKCIDKAGLASNSGCPVVEEKTIKRLEYAAKAIQFEVGKDIIKPISFSKLDDIVKVLKEYTDYNILVDGHTDNMGKPENNQLLSEKRAAAVKNYFISRGIVESRITATGFGASKPLIPNTSTANKTQNRRVEISLKL